MPPTDNGSVTRGDLIEQKLDKQVAGAVVLDTSRGGVQFSNMMEVMEFSKLMALSQQAVPPHLRNQPGMCLAICVQAAEWRMSPFAVANKSYSVNDRLGWESQLIHAVIEQRAPLAGRLRHRYEGEGDERVCIVTGRIRGEQESFEYRSPEIKKIVPKNSPLWRSKPDLQLYYNTVRDFARVYFPDVLLGVYAEDEIDARSVGVSTPDAPSLDDLDEPETIDLEQPEPIEA